jgi:hypothetical protein
MSQTEIMSWTHFINKPKFLFKLGSFIKLIKFESSLYKLNSNYPQTYKIVHLQPTYSCRFFEDFIKTIIFLVKEIIKSLFGIVLQNT